MFSSPNIRLLHMYLALLNRTSPSSQLFCCFDWKCDVFLVKRRSLNRMKIRTWVMRTIYIFSPFCSVLMSADHFHTCRIQPNNTEKRSAHMAPRENAPHCTKPHCHQSVALLLTVHVSRRCNARDKKKFRVVFCAVFFVARVSCNFKCKLVLLVSRTRSEVYFKLAADMAFNLLSALFPTRYFFLPWRNYNSNMQANFSLPASPEYNTKIVKLPLGFSLSV